MNRRTFLNTFLSTTAAAASSAVRPLAIATFQEDVTPPIGAVLCHGLVEPAKTIVDRLTARGIILFSADEPIVLCAVDWVGIENDGHDAWRNKLAAAVGTVPARVAVHTLHQHDAPAYDPLAARILTQHQLGGRLFDEAFGERALTGVAQAVRRAASKPLAVTHAGAGHARVERVASSRRVLGAGGKIEFVRMSSCRNEAARAAPEGVIDPELRLITFWHGERPLAALSYYATHPQSYYGKGGVSADFVGMARTIRESVLPGVAHIHFNGAGGNVAAGKYNDGAPENRPLLAARLAAGMQGAWEATRRFPVTAADLRWRATPVMLPARVPSESGLLAGLDNPELKLNERLRNARDLAWLARQRAGKQIELSMLQLGNLRVLNMPGELFVEYQLAAQKMRPADFVAMAAYGDLGPGYVGTAIAYTQGGYETGPVSRVAPAVEGVLQSGMRYLLEA